MITKRQLVHAGLATGLALAPFSAASQPVRSVVAFTFGEFFQEFAQFIDTSLNITHLQSLSIPRFAQTSVGIISQILDKQTEIKAALDNVRYTVRAEIFHALYNEDVRIFQGDLAGAMQVLPQIPVGSGEHAEFMAEFVEKMDFHAAKLSTYGPEAFPVYILSAFAQLLAHRINGSPASLIAMYSQRHIDKLRSWITPRAPQSLTTQAFEIRQNLLATQQALQAPVNLTIGHGTQRQAWTGQMIAEQRRNDVYLRRLYGPNYPLVDIFPTYYQTTRYEMVFRGFNSQRQPVIEFLDTPTGIYETSQLPAHLNQAPRTTDPYGRMMVWQNNNHHTQNNQHLTAIAQNCVAPLHNQIVYSERQVNNSIGRIRECMERHYTQFEQRRGALEAELRPYLSVINGVEIAIRRINNFRASLRMPVQTAPWHQLRHRQS